MKDQENYKIDKIAAIESRGFVFASAVSYLVKKAIYYVLRKEKQTYRLKLILVDFELEYGKATIEVHKDSIDKDDSSFNYR